jgi:hypothetical protein
MFLFINGKIVLAIKNIVIETILNVITSQLVLIIGAISDIVHNVQIVYNRQKFSFDE